MTKIHTFHLFKNEQHTCAKAMQVLHSSQNTFHSLVTFSLISSIYWNLFPTSTWEIQKIAQSYFRWIRYLIYGIYLMFSRIIIILFQLENFLQVAQKIFGLKVYEVPFVKELRYLMYYAKKNTLLRKIIGIFSNFVVGHKDNGQLADVCEHLIISLLRK